MRRLILFIITFIFFIILIGEPTELNAKIIILKGISLLWFCIISKIASKEEQNV